MVKIAVAGGSGRTALNTQTLDQITLTLTTEVGREVIDALVAAKKHEVMILTRSAVSDPDTLWFPLLYC